MVQLVSFFTTALLESVLVSHLIHSKGTIGAYRLKYHRVL